MAYMISRQGQGSYSGPSGHGLTNISVEI